MSLSSARAADPQLPTTKGFVVTRFASAFYEGKTGQTAAWDKSDGLPECPEGLTLPPDTDAVLAELNVPPAERERLKRPENSGEAGELVMTILHRGPNNTDVCFHPQTVPDPGFRIVQGKVAYGLDLDGSDGAMSPLFHCPHENFVGPKGERGIDNQVYRALGCIKGRRQGSGSYDYSTVGLRQGDYSILIELAGVDDAKNDDEVAVGFYSGQEPMMTNVEGVPLTHASLRVHHDDRYHAVTRGKIVDGVLNTEPVEMLLTSIGGSEIYHLRNARFRGELQPDGSLKGLLGGYQDTDTIFRKVVTDGTTIETRTSGPITCPGLYYALRRLADAYPQTPGNGPCTWISAAYEIEALPAFVIHPKESREPILAAPVKPGA